MAAPDTCLSGPQGAAPQGQRWYYHLDRATKQKCWYLRAPGDSAAQAAATPPAATQSPAPAAAPSRAAARQPDGTKVQNARAEWPTPQTGDAPDATGSIQQAAQPAPWPQANPGAQQDTPAQPAAMTPPAADAFPAPPSAAPPPPTAPAAAQALQTAQDAAPATKAGAGAAKSSEPVHTLLLVIAGALVLAGVVASIVFRLSARQRTARQDHHARRFVNWEPAVSSEPPPRRATPAPLRIVAPAPIAAAPRSDYKTSDYKASDHETHDRDTHDRDTRERESDDDADIGQITDLLEQFIKQGPKLDSRLDHATPAAKTAPPDLQRLQRLAQSSARI